MTLYDILDLIWYAFSAVILIPIGLGMRRYSQLPDKDRLIVWFLVLLFLIEVIATILRYNIVRNHFMNYFRTLAVLWISVFIYHPGGKWERLPIILASSLTLALPVEVLGWVGFNHINSVTRTIAWLLLMIYAFIGLNALFQNLYEQSLRQNALLYYYLGFLTLGFFSAGTSSFENYFIETSLDLYYFADTLVVMMSAVAYILFSIGLQKRYQSHHLVIRS